MSSLAYRELVDLDGKLAIHLGTSPERDTPRLVATYYVSDYRADDPFVANLIGKIVHGHNAGYGYAIRPDGTDITVDYRQWTSITISTPVPKPRDGREYTWKWDIGEWRKDGFPRCDECREYHDPTRRHCDHCGKSMPESVKGQYHPKCKAAAAELAAEIAAWNATH